MPYSGPGDLTPAPTYQDPSSLSGPVPVIINNDGSYYVDPSVYDPTRAVSADAVYLSPDSFGGGVAPITSDTPTVAAPDSPTYANQVVIWGSNPGTPEQAVATYQAYDAGTASPSYGNTITKQLAYLPPDLVEGAAPDPTYVPPTIDYYPAPSFHTDTTVSGGVTTTVQTYDQPNGGAPVMDAAFSQIDYRTNPLVQAAIAVSGAPGFSTTTKTTIPPVIPEDGVQEYATGVIDNAQNYIQGATNAADQYIAANYPAHAAKDNTWLYVLGAFALLMFLRR